MKSGLEISAQLVPTSSPRRGAANVDDVVVELHRSIGGDRFRFNLRRLASPLVFLDPLTERDPGGRIGENDEDRNDDDQGTRHDGVSPGGFAREAGCEKSEARPAKNNSGRPNLDRPDA